MKELRKKVSYLQGLAEGLEVKSASKEGRIINGIIEVLGDLANNLDNLWEVHQELETYMEAIDEDLYELEGDLFEDSEEGNGPDKLVEVDCPKCHDLVCFAADVLEDEDVIEVTCPTCNEVVFVNDGSFDFEPAIIGPEETPNQKSYQGDI